jgi:cytochrome b561
MQQTLAYDRISQILHWLLALLVFFLILFHPSTEEGHRQSSDLSAIIHVSAGVMLFIFLLTRIIWRINFAFVPATPEGDEVQTRVRKFTHLAFYIFMLLSPLLGVAVSLSSDLNIRIFNLLEIPRLITDESRHDLLRSLHGFSADVLLYLSVVHVSAALYHQFWLKDRLINRMLNKSG